MRVMLLLTQKGHDLSLDSKVEDVANALYVKFNRTYSLPLVAEVMEELSIDTRNKLIENSELPADYGNLYN